MLTPLYVDDLVNFEPGDQDWYNQYDASFIICRQI